MHLTRDSAPELYIVKAQLFLGTSYPSLVARGPKLHNRIALSINFHSLHMILESSFLINKSDDTFKKAEMADECSVRINFNTLIPKSKVH